MKALSKVLQKYKIIQIVFLFFIFHIFWLSFYFLSDAVFIRDGALHIYYKFFVINSVGFFAFCISAFVLFPSFIPWKKYFLLFITSVFIMGLFGYVQFLLQDWAPQPIFRKEGVATASSGFAASMVKMQQSSGAFIRSVLNILVYLLLGIGYAYMKDWFIKDRRTQLLEKEKTKAELALLRYQLNPHFLFNTINDIYYLAIIKSEKTAEAILKVSGLLRYVLDHKSETVLLEKELNHLQQFLELQQFRFPDQVVELNLDIQDEIGNYEIAPLLLSTFAENAFKHGEPGTIETPVKITISIKDNVLDYSVINKINRQIDKDITTGIGLNNLKKRISLLYEGKHRLNIKEENEYFYANLNLQLL
jgi:sensor histidine kinase YesM